MKNVTITLDQEVVRWARIRAAEKDTSLSRLVGEMLREKMLEESAYEASMHHYLGQAPQELTAEGGTYPNREELHERPRLR